jgi:hypothetical protein
VAAFVGLVV